VITRSRRLNGIISFFRFYRIFQLISETNIAVFPRLSDRCHFITAVPSVLVIDRLVCETALFTSTCIYIIRDWTSWLVSSWQVSIVRGEWDSACL